MQERKQTQGRIARTNHPPSGLAGERMTPADAKTQSAGEVAGGAAALVLAGAIQRPIRLSEIRETVRGLTPAQRRSRFLIDTLGPYPYTSFSDKSVLPPQESPAAAAARGISSSAGEKTRRPGPSPPDSTDPLLPGPTLGGFSGGAMAQDLIGKIAIVTGAAGGIGTEVARLFDRLGLRLVLTDINPDGLEKTARLLAGDAQCLVCDVTKPGEVRDLVEEAVWRFGTIDILVNNAGVIRPGLFEECVYPDMERQVQINLLGTMACTREVIPVMQKGGGGHIVTVSSLAGIVPETRSSVYTATKFALRGFNLALAVELRGHRIHVSTIFPDSVATPMLLYEAEHGGSPLTFLGAPQHPERVARAIWKAIQKNQVEVYVPVSVGVLSKAVMCWPWAVTRLWPLLERLGEGNRAAVRRRLRESFPA